MSKDIKNITDNVMAQINQGKIKMKPRIYFLIGSILTFMGLVSTIVVSTFLMGLLRFSLRTHYGPGAQYKLYRALSEFPWWIVLLAIASLVGGIWFVRKYDFSYKINPFFLIIGFILVILVSGLAIDFFGFNDLLLRHGFMNGMMKNYIR